MRDLIRSFLYKTAIYRPNLGQQMVSPPRVNLTSPKAIAYQRKVKALLSPRLASRLIRLPTPKWVALSYCLDEDHLELFQGELEEVGLRAVINEESSSLSVGLTSDSDEVLKRDGVRVELWRRSPLGDLVPNFGNHWISSIPAIPSPLELTDSQRTGIDEIDFPIDAVYLWVDGSDKAWNQKLREVTGNINSSSNHASDRARFESFDELEHSVASLRRNAPWLRNTFIVTDEQDPRVKFTLPGVCIIDHQAIIPERFLPTFNSNVISLYLKNIPELSNCFLYVNDDVFLGKPTEPNYFFDSNQTCKARLTRTALPAVNSQGAHVLHLARANTIRMASKRGLLTSSRSLYHGPHPMRKDLLDEVFSNFSVEIEQASHNKLRSGNDIVIEWLHFFYAFSTRREVFENAQDYVYLNINIREEYGDLEKFLRKKLPRVISLNQAAEIPAEQRATPHQIQGMLNRVWKKLEEATPLNQKSPPG